MKSDVGSSAGSHPSLTARHVPSATTSKREISSPRPKSKEKAKEHDILQYKEADTKSIRSSSMWNHSVRLYQPEVPVDCQHSTSLQERTFPDESRTVCVV